MEQTLVEYIRGAIRTRRINEGRVEKMIGGLLTVLCLVGCSSDENNTRTMPEGDIVLRGISYTVAPIDFPQLLFTRADGVNDAGQIVGTGACIDPCGFLFPPGSLFSIPGALLISPKDINNVGQIVGSFGNRLCNGIPFLTDGFLLDTNTSTFTPINFPGASSAGCPPGNVS